jgi:hypothetical protein
MMQRIRNWLQNRPFFRVVINQSKAGHTPCLQTRRWFFFWRTVQVNPTQREFDDVLVSLGVSYFDYLGRNMKRLGISKQHLKSRAGRFSKRVVKPGMKR